MSFIPLQDRPWRRPGELPASLPAHWAQPARLGLQVDSWRRWLSDQPGQHWLLCLKDAQEFVAALLALWECGRIAVLPADDRPATLAALARQTDGQILSALEPAVPTAANVAKAPQLLPERTALVLYTSGSTGQPVEVTKTFSQLQAELDVHRQLWPLGPQTGVISQVSHQHIYGLLAGLLHPLCAGVPFCGGDYHYPERLAKCLVEAGQAGLQPVLISSPPQLARLPEHIRWTELPRLLRVFSSGAPLAATDALRAEHLLDSVIIEIYGSTETGGIAQRRQSSSPHWQALPGVELCTDDGYLVLRSPFLIEPHQWWHQPDRIHGNAQCFELLGRADRIVKIAGKRVSLEHIERLLVDHPRISAARCVELGRSDGRLGCLLVISAEELPQEHQPRLELLVELRQLLAAHLEQVAIPRYWRLLEKLPSNAQGKLDRALISRLFEDLEDRRKPRWLGTEWLNAERCEISLEVPERLIFLDGHFDGLPVVPGVVIVQWVVEQAANSFGPLGVFSGCEQLKFQLPMHPGLRLRLELTRRTDGVAFSFHSHAGRLASGCICFTAQAETAHD